LFKESVTANVAVKSFVLAKNVLKSHSSGRHSAIKKEFAMSVSQKYLKKQERT
jgi:hypothetical protein